MRAPAALFSFRTSRSLLLVLHIIVIMIKCGFFLFVRVQHIYHMRVFYAGAFFFLVHFSIVTVGSRLIRRRRRRHRRRRCCCCYCDERACVCSAGVQMKYDERMYNRKRARYAQTAPRNAKDRIVWPTARFPNPPSSFVLYSTYARKIEHLCVM